MSDEDNVPVTVLDCAAARGAKAGPDGSFTMGDIDAVGLPFFGGCEHCHASIACHNAYPSRTNYLRCRACIGDLGFATTGEFEAWCRQFDADQPPDDDGDVDQFGNRNYDDDSRLVIGDEPDIEDIERAIDEGY